MRIRKRSRSKGAPKIIPGLNGSLKNSTHPRKCERLCIATSFIQSVKSSRHYSTVLVKHFYDRHAYPTIVKTPVDHYRLLAAPKIDAHFRFTHTIPSLLFLSCPLPRCMVSKFRSTNRVVNAGLYSIVYTPSSHDVSRAQMFDQFLRLNFGLRTFLLEHSIRLTFLSYKIVILKAPGSNQIIRKSLCRFALL